MSRGAWSSSACFHRVDLRILPNSKRAATALRLACICDQNTTLPLRNYISLRGVHVNRSCQVWSVNGMRMRLLLTCYISKRLLYDNMRKARGARGREASTCDVLTEWHRGIMRAIYGQSLLQWCIGLPGLAVMT
jgi:hypothetical protein